MKKGNIFAYAHTPTIIREYSGIDGMGYYGWDDVENYNDPDGFEGYGDATQDDDEVVFIAKNNNEYDATKRGLYYKKVAHLITEEYDME